MGTRTDCLKLTLQPETQAHCRWGSSNFSLLHHDDRPAPKVDDVKPAGERTPAPPQVKRSMIVRGEGGVFPVLPERAEAFDFYTPPAPENPWVNFSLPSVTLFKTRLGSLQLRVGIWATPTGFSTETDRPMSVFMEQWKNGGVPFPPGVEYRSEIGLRVYF